MAFNLKLVLKALIFSTGQPLSIKDIQAAFARFHDQAAGLLSTKGAAEESIEEATKIEEGAARLAQDAEVTGGNTGTGEAGEITAVEPADADLYADVPSLITAAQIREAMDELAADLRMANDVYLLIDGVQGYRLVTHPRFGRWIRILRDEPPPTKLSQSALETLAIVAYRQPVTRSELEAIRGVSAEGSLNKLLERELVYVMGRADLPGRPLQYGTTDQFLEFVGVKSLVELPASDVLSPRQIDEWLKNATNATPPADSDMGLPLEVGEGDSPNFEAVTVEHNEAPGEAAPTTPKVAGPAEPMAAGSVPTDTPPTTREETGGEPASA